MNKKQALEVLQGMIQKGNVKRIVNEKITEDFKDGHLVHRKTERKEYVPKEGE